MKLNITKEEYILNKALNILRQSTFPEVRVGYLMDTQTPVLVLYHGYDTYYRNININSISASVRELSDVTNGEFKNKWQKMDYITQKREDIYLLDSIKDLIPEGSFDFKFMISIDLNNLDRKV